MKRGRLLLSVLLTVVVALGALGAVIATGVAPLLGLDLQGGISVVYKPVHPVSNALLDEAINIIRDRVDALGVAQPSIGRQGDDIVVQLPGVRDRAHALAIIGQTAELEFRPVICPPSGTGSLLPPGPETKSGQPLVTLTTTPPACSSSTNFAKVPSTARSADLPNRTVLLPQIDPKTGQVMGRYELGPSELTGKALKTAQAEIDTANGQWLVAFTLTPKGEVGFNKMAKANYGKQVAIVLDGRVESAPTIDSQSFPGQGQITGQFTESQAKTLALELRYGALPVPLQQENVVSVSPTLGKAALRAGIVAALGGLALVMIYTIIYYRALGIVVVVGLGLTAALLYAIISALSQSVGLALDLSGVTGLIVSIGITVDSYIVYFERLKDEVRAGNSVRVSVDKSFARAFRTIVAADLVSLIGAAVLYLLSIGQVKGFAFFLGLSTVLDVLTSWIFTRPLVILLGRNRLFTEARWLGVARGLAAPTTGGAGGRSAGSVVPGVGR